MHKTAGDIIILHMCTKNHNHMRYGYGSWDTEWDRQVFLSFQPTTCKIKILKKLKKHLEMMYASWDMKCDRHDLLSFWAIFCPFTPLLTSKTKIWEKCKTLLEISFYKCVPSINEDHMIRGSWDIRCNRQFYIIFGNFLPTDPPTYPKN